MNESQGVALQVAEVLQKHGCKKDVQNVKEETAASILAVKKEQDKKQLQVEGNKELEASSPPTTQSSGGCGCVVS